MKTYYLVVQNFSRACELALILHKGDEPTLARDLDKEAAVTLWKAFTNEHNRLTMFGVYGVQVIELFGPDGKIYNFIQKEV